MELIDYLRMLRRQWLWVVGSVVVLTVLAAVYVSVAPKSYRATSDIYIVGTIPTDAQNPNDAAQSASKFVFDNIDTFAALVDSPQVTLPVVKALNLTATTTPEQLAKQVTATVVPNTVIITVAATDASPKMAADIANQTATSLSDAISNLAIPGDSAVAPVDIHHVKAAVPPTSPDSPNRTLWLALGVLLGLALGLVIATLREQVRRTSKAASAVDASTDVTSVDPPSVDLAKALSGGSARAASPRPVADEPLRVGSAPSARTVDPLPGPETNGSRVAEGSNGAASSTPIDPEGAPRDPAPTRR